MKFFITITGYYKGISFFPRIESDVLINNLKSPKLSKNQFATISVHIRLYTPRLFYRLALNSISEG